MNATAWRVTLAATALMAVGSGLRIASGLFVSPLNSATGLGLGLLSLIFAAGQLALGLAQPTLGGLADRVGAAPVVAAGAVALAAATALLALPAWFALDAAGTAFTLAGAVVVAAVANGAISGNALLVGEVNRRVGPAQAGLAVGLVSAGASLGQLLFGPGVQQLIESLGWAPALLAAAALALLAVPLALGLRRPASDVAAAPPPDAGDALRDPVFWRIAASFGICGFHVSFLAVHMPGVIERCGLPDSLAGTWIAVAGVANIAGTLWVGLAMRTHDIARLLVALYAVRALGVAALLLAPPTAAVLMLFALVMGASHMATLPPTAQLVARRHGVARLGALLGVVMLVHQVGGFAGVWLGGWAAAATGSDRALWLADTALALAAAALAGSVRRRG